MYIQYTMDQLCLPMDLEEDIPQNHLVRIVNAAVNQLDDVIFDAAYPGGGRDSYHPKMLTKSDHLCLHPAYLLLPTDRQGCPRKRHVHVDCRQTTTRLPHH
ncbi:transposase [Paenibacillus sp. V4I7]|nr:transposase [Paenibacillus sp. V4I7]